MKCEMLKYLITAFLLTFQLSFLSAQDKFNFSAYILELPAYQYVKESSSDLINTTGSSFTNLTRLRLRPSLRITKSTKISMEYEIDALYNSRNTGISTEGTEKNKRQLFDLGWTPVNETNLRITHFIDRLYIEQGFRNGNIIAGRQRISWGTGRIWNPTDLFNPINPAVFYKYEKDGADAVSFKYAFGSFTDINLIYNPQEKIRQSNTGMRFRTNFSEYDISLMGGYFDKRAVAGLDFAGNFFDAGLRGEGIYSVNTEFSGDNFLKFILGIDNQFTPEFYALLEYHFNGEGKTDRNEYDFERLAKGEIQNLSKNYICASGTYLINPLLSLTLTEITNLNDGSGFINLTGAFSASSDLNLSLGTQVMYGTEKSEYNYYPFFLFLLGQYYF